MPQPVADRIKKLRDEIAALTERTACTCAALSTAHLLRQALRRMRKRPNLVIAFWQQAEVFPM